jgi:histone H1/5
MDATTALAIYRAEKDKALRERRVSHVQLMAEAQEAFRKMLADAQLARKGGRPKGSTNAVAAAPQSPPPTPAIPPGKLVLKTTKTSPAKGAEKVTAAASAAAVSTKTAKAPSATAVARPAAKQTSPKKAATAKAASAAKPTRRAAAPAARKGSAKKPKAPRKQAAARERKAKGRKH